MYRLSIKCGIKYEALSKHCLGVYIFLHKENKKLRYCGASSDLVNDIENIFNINIKNKDEHIHPIEKMIRISPFVNDWAVRIKMVESNMFILCIDCQLNVE